MKALEKLMFWQIGGQTEAPEPLPSKGPNDPPAIDIAETPAENATGEDRPSGFVSKSERRFQRGLFEEHDRMAEDHQPPDSERS